MDNSNKDMLPISTRVDTAADVAAIAANLIPSFGSVVAQVLSGWSQARRFSRVRDAIIQVSNDLIDLESQVSADYISTDEFEELLEKTLLAIAEERSEDKRTMYARFLETSMKLPGDPYDDKLRHLQTLENMQPGHVLLLKALLQEPDTKLGYSGSPIATLRRRLPGVSSERITEWAQDLTDWRIANLADGLHTSMTARGAEELKTTLTPYGRRFVAYVMSDSET